MSEWLVRLTEITVTVIDGLALLMIAWGAAQAFIGAVGLAVTRGRRPPSS